METPLSTKQTKALIFVFGSLKRGFTYHNIIQDFIDTQDAVYMGRYKTHLPYPLVFGDHGRVYLIDQPGLGHQIKGELYAISTTSVDLLDEFEDVHRGLYERISVQVESQENGGDVVDAEGYFVHRSFGMALWDKYANTAADEFTEEQAKKFVRNESLSVEDVLDGLRAISSSYSMNLDKSSNVV